MLTFVAAVVLLIITPGPGVMSCAGMGAAYGFRRGVRWVVGLAIGNNLGILAVITGVTAVLFAEPTIRYVLLGLSSLYLLYLAGKIAFAGSRLAFGEPKRAPGIWDGILLQAVNPKLYVVNTTLFTGFAYAPDNLVFEIVTKFLILNLLWVPIHLGWLWAGAVLHRLDLPERTHRRINIAMAAAMLAVVALALFSTLRGTL